MSAGLTQKMLAAAAGVSIGALRDLEQGRTATPGWATVSAIAAALSLDHLERSELASAWSGGLASQDPWSASSDHGIWPDGTDLRIGILGHLTVRRNGTTIDLGSQRQRVVLGLLALHSPSGVRPDAVVDTLWGERPPPSATAQVQAQVSRLRRLLGPDLPDSDAAVRLAGSGYQLGEAVRLDLTEFLAVARRAGTATARGDCRLACALYERCLGLWRGEVLADLDALQSHPAVVAVTRHHGQAVLHYARAATASGHPERALAHLHAVCEREPFNEQAHGALMAALAAGGQRAAALQLFGQLRRRLDAEFGLQPGAQLAAAQLHILRQHAG